MCPPNACRESPFPTSGVNTGAGFISRRKARRSGRPGAVAQLALPLFSGDHPPRISLAAVIHRHLSLANRPSQYSSARPEGSPADTPLVLDPIPAVGKAPSQSGSPAFGLAGEQLTGIDIHSGEVLWRLDPFHPFGKRWPRRTALHFDGQDRVKVVAGPSPQVVIRRGFAFPCRAPFRRRTALPSIGLVPVSP